MAKKNIDMTRGSLTRAIVEFSIPLVLSGLLQQMYNWADAFIVGNIEGELALAAVGASGVVSRLIIMIIVGFTGGLTILAAQLFGKGESGRIRSLVAVFAPLFGGIALAAAMVLFVYAREMLTFYDTPANIFEMSVSYLRFCLLGTPFMAVYNVYSAVLRGIGDSKAPLWAITISSIGNIIFDLLFIGVFGWGTAGAAVATSLSQAIMTVFIVVYTIGRYGELRFSLKGWRLDRDTLSEGIKFGIPMAIQQSINSVGQMALQGFQNSFGSATVAAISTAYRVDSVMLLPVFNMTQSIATAVGQNVGTGNKERVRESLRVGLRLIGGVSLVLTLIVVMIGGKMVSLFGVSQEAVDIGTRFFRILGPFYIMTGLGNTYSSYLRGLGDMKFTSGAQIASLGLRIALSYAMKPIFGNMSIAWAEAVTWTVQLAVAFWRTKYFEKKNRA
ncbi:MAG: MATE family efflux transporter [Clostridia bacterium]|nr:MATE family efflux transporter [Clostridia bacterium]